MEVEVIDNEGNSEEGKIIKDNGDGTFKAIIYYPFGDCEAIIMEFVDVYGNKYYEFV